MAKATFCCNDYPHCKCEKCVTCGVTHPEDGECIEKPKKTAEEIKLMMACRNIIVRAQDAILEHKWVFGETKIDSHYMFTMLLKYGKKAWAPTQKVFLPTREAGMARKTLYRCQCSAVDAGILTRTGESYMGYPMFLIDFGTLVEWTEKKPYEREIEHGLANVKRLPIDPGDAAEEKAGWAEDDPNEEDDGLNTVEAFLARSNSDIPDLPVASIIGAGLY